MPSPAPLVPSDEIADAGLAESLASLAREGRVVARDVALGAFRRHLARIQSHVQHAFEHDQLTGLQAARLLASLMDGLIRELFVQAQRVWGGAERLSLA